MMATIAMKGRQSVAAAAMTSPTPTMPNPSITTTPPIAAVPGPRRRCEPTRGRLIARPMGMKNVEYAPRPVMIPPGSALLGRSFGGRQRQAEASFFVADTIALEGRVGLLGQAARDVRVPPPIPERERVTYEAKVGRLRPSPRRN